MQVTLRRRTADDEQRLSEMLQTCVRELAAIERWPDGDLRFTQHQLFTSAFDPAAHTLLIDLDDTCRGFTVVIEDSIFSKDRGARTVLTLYLDEAYRGSGHGLAAATQLFTLLPGHWEVATPAANVQATAFWRAVANHVTDGRYVERWSQNTHFRGNVEIFSYPVADQPPM